MSIRTVGIIGRPHGVKGFVTVRLYTDYPKSIKEGDIFLTDPSSQGKLIVDKVKPGKRDDCILVKFLNLEDRNSVEHYRDLYLYRPAEKSPCLEEGKYWADDIPGCRVYYRDKLVGSVNQTIETPANYVLSLDIESEELKPSLGKNVLVPFIDSYIQQVKIEDRVIILKKLPEYI